MSTATPIAIAITLSAFILALGFYGAMRAVYVHNVCISSVMIAPEKRVNDVRAFCGLREREVVIETEV